VNLKMYTYELKPQVNRNL